MGAVARVSGPVVIADGLPGAKMFDVVRVGDLGLIGEIIRLVGETASIQCYEDTTGIRPGDKVENTGKALSVELGPGLLTSIYDGIQRPLDVLKQNLGDFITRGSVAAPLDEKKRWEFTATATVGQEVEPGTILGTVPETPLILHKVMVPNGVTGTLVRLLSGTYTIRDQIGEVKTRGGAVPLGLSQKWVVRIPRPVREKLPPDIPLLTGQRVIDTFYPVAKGGAACIPGPFGSGKCLGGETPVLLGDGRVASIDELYATARKDGEVTIDGSDEWIKLNAGLDLFSLVDNKMVHSRSKTLYKGRSDSLVRVKTRSGRSVRVTPVHRLFTIRPSGILQETAARDLKPGDYIASIRQLPAPQADRKVSVRLPKLQRPGKTIRIPPFMTPDFAEFLGLFVAEGCVRRGRVVVFTNSEDRLLQRFLQLTKELFGIQGQIERRGRKIPNAVVFSKSLVDLMDLLGTGRECFSKHIPPLVLSSSNKTLGAFLLGYYLGDGRVYRYQIEFSTASRPLQTELSYALSRFGITYSLASRVVEGTDYFRVFVRGVANFSKVRDLLASDHPKVVPIGRYVDAHRVPRAQTDVVPLSPSVIERIYRGHLTHTGLKADGIEVCNYVGNRERMSAATFQGFMGSSGWDDAGILPEWDATRLAELPDWVFCDEVVEVHEDKEGPFDVYDVCLPEYGSNFVGGYGGLLLHNTVAQQQLAKWSDADVVVYVGCGERGNEMTEVLATFPKLIDPKSKRPLMERTILIANTSNMPVAAREASVYTGITLAEYYRDMGYDVALMADSTSRWAEAMREISGRLEEMPGEEGYPAYLGRRVAEFYERSGRVTTVSPEGRQGSVSVVGAVSPPGGDTSEPVSQNTLRVVRVFWALDAGLANRRHFPSINWLQSYSLYAGELEPWYRTHIAPDWGALRQRAIQTLQQEAELQELVQLVGVDALPEREKVTLDIARMIREDFLQQSAYDDIDTYTSIKKQYRMLRTILRFGDQEQEAVLKGATLAQIAKLPVRGRVSRMKWTKEADVDTTFNQLELDITAAVAGVIQSAGAPGALDVAVTAGAS
ncbi:MAG: V-type ATP synthase subunit A [Thermoplasmata archaeon]|nr:V-type ATP synthase subunit A [Thermoplasmata archaeon]